jgi:hypothetical protein
MFIPSGRDPARPSATGGVAASTGWGRDSALIEPMSGQGFGEVLQQGIFA